MSGSRRIFLTGAAGFIGSRLAGALIKEGHRVGILVRKGSDLSRLYGLTSRLAIYHGDIRDGDTISGCIGDYAPDTIVHLVTYYAVEHRSNDIGTMIDTNVRGTVNLLEAARIHRVGQFVNASTCAVYAEQDRPLNEEDPVNPQNLYAVTKIQAEMACRFYAINYGVKAITLRLFPPYGPGDHERRLIPYVILSFFEGKSPTLTTGLQKWDFVYVDDVVDAFCAVIRKYTFSLPYDVVNIGTGHPTSVHDVVVTLMHLTGRNLELSWGVIPHRKNEVWFNSANISKAAALIGWSPATALEDGLKKTLDWWRDHPDVRV